MAEWIYTSQKAVYTAEEIIDNGLYDAAVELMDYNIRTELSAKLAPCSKLDFLIAYMNEHRAMYGEDFDIV